MSDLERTPDAPVSELGAEEREVRSLLEMAGPRPPIPEEDLAAITAAARATWRQATAEPAPETPFGRSEAPRGSRRSRSYGPWALAATIVLAVAAAFWWGGNRMVDVAPAPIVVAEAQRVWGTASLETSEGAGGVAEGMSLSAGSRVSTFGAEAANRLALLLEGGTSLRLDRGTRVRLISATELELEAGAVYLDTGAEERPAVVVHTPFGPVTDIGTQFSVRLPDADRGDGALEVRVREGEVEVAAIADGIHAVPAGTELLLAADGSGTRRQIEAFGPEWEWILDTTPRFDVEGMTLEAFLAWVTRETGWEVRIDDPALEASTESTTLHGTTGGLRPDRAAFVVLTGAGLEGELSGGTFTIRRARAP